MPRLQSLDRAADRGLRKSHRLGRTRHVLAFRNGNKNPKLFQRHDATRANQSFYQIDISIIIDFTDQEKISRVSEALNSINAVTASELPTDTSRWRAVTDIAPGLALAALVAAIAWFAAKVLPSALPVPAMVLALVVGTALNPLASRPAFAQGLRICVRNILRIAIALMGLRVGLGDILGLGIATVILVILAMAATIAAGFLLARWHGQSPEFGALVGVGTAVCGASATLATSTVLRDYPGKQADIAFVVVAVNALATLALILYPPLCLLLGFDQETSGIMLGATIHDVAQVAGAGYAMSEATGNIAVVVKLFRVFLLLPVVLCVGLYFRSLSGGDGPSARVPVPVFAIVFLLLCVLNSVAPGIPALASPFNTTKDILIDVSSIGLLLAISALGLSTSIKQITSLGWRHMSTVCGTTMVIFAIAIAALHLHYW